MNKFLVLLLGISIPVMGFTADRVIDADVIKSSDHTKTWTLPSASGNIFADAQHNLPAADQTYELGSASFLWNRTWQQRVFTRFMFNLTGQDLTLSSSEDLFLLATKEAEMQSGAGFNLSLTNQGPLLDIYSADETLINSVDTITLTSANDIIATGADAVTVTATAGDITLSTPGANKGVVLTNTLRMPEVASPTTPAAGRLLYAKSDGKFYHKGTDGVETAIGSGAGGENILVESSVSHDAESNSTGWSQYMEASDVFVDGTGGTPNATFSRDTVSANRLQDLWTFYFGAAQVGNGVSAPLSVDKRFWGTTIECKVDYRITSFLSFYNDGDMEFRVYDMDSGAEVIQISSEDILKSAKGTHYARIPIPAEGGTFAGNLRIAVHQKGISAGWGFYFDNVVCGSIATPRGPPVSEWQTYTPTFGAGFGSVITHSLWYRRVGDSLEVKGYFISATVAAAEASMTLPAGLSFDSTKLHSGTQSEIIGRVERATAAATDGGYYALVLADSTSYSKVWFPSGNNGNSPATRALNASSLFAGTEKQFINFKGPVTGWGGSGTISTTDNTQRKIAVWAYSTSALGVTANTTINLPTEGYDYGGVFSAGVFTCPDNELYEAKISGFYTGGSAYVYLAKNGTKQGNAISNLIAASVVNGTKEIECRTGDTWAIQPSATTTLAVAAGNYYPEIFISKKATPQVLNKDDQICAASVYLNANTAVTVNTPIPYTTVDIDQCNSITTGASFKYTARDSGTYTVGGAVNSSAGNYYNIYKNGVSTKTVAYDSASEVGSISGIIKLKAGEYIDIRPISSSATSYGGAINAGVNIVTIQRTGNY